MEILLLIILSILVGVGVRWLVGAKEQYLELFEDPLDKTKK